MPHNPSPFPKKSIIHGRTRSRSGPLTVSAGMSFLTVHGGTRNDFLKLTSDLWDNVRNPLTHSVTSFTSLGRDPALDLTQMEEVVIQMVRAVTTAWRNEQFEINPYDFLLAT